MSQVSVSAAEIRAAGGLEIFARRLEGQALLGAGRILSVREGKGKGKTKPGEPTEEQEQAAVIAWAKAHEGQCPALALLFHVPNGGHRHVAVAKKLAGQGVKSGVPDLCLPVPRKGYHGLYIELKRCTKGRVSPIQQWWLDQLKAHGCRAVVCRGADAAIAEIQNYLGV